MSIQDLLPDLLHNNHVQCIPCKLLCGISPVINCIGRKHWLNLHAVNSGAAALGQAAVRYHTFRDGFGFECYRYMPRATRHLFMKPWSPEPHQLPREISKILESGPHLEQADYHDPRARLLDCLRSDNSHFGLARPHEKLLSAAQKRFAF